MNQAIFTNVRECKKKHFKVKHVGNCNPMKISKFQDKNEWQMMSKFKSPQYTIKKLLKNKY